MARSTTEPRRSIAYRSPRGRVAAAIVASALVLAASTREARAEPYLGLRIGRPCAECHVNLTGGGMRNAHGVLYGLESLPWRPISALGEEEPFKGRVTDRFHVGGDLRAAHESIFAASANTNEFATREGNLYASFVLLRERLRLYADEHVAPGSARSREAFALLENLPGKIHVKAGRLFPAFGWRLQDDTAFIRTATGFIFDAPDDGVEIGWRPGKVDAALTITNGNGGAAGQGSNKQASLLTAFTNGRLRAGVSAAANRQGDDDRHMGGVFAGLRAGPVVLLAEVDAMRSESLSGAPPPGSLRGTTRQIAGYAEADWETHQGLNVKAAFDYLDPDTSQSGDEVNRVSAGVEAAPTPYLQLRLIWRRTDRPPEVHGLLFEDDRELLAELHLFL